MSFNTQYLQVALCIFHILYHEALIFVWFWFPETSTGLPPAVSSNLLSLDQDSWIGFSFQQFYSVTGCFPSITSPDEALHRFSQNLAVLTLATVSWGSQNQRHSLTIYPKLLFAEDINFRPMGLTSMLCWTQEFPSGFHHCARSSVLHLGCSSSCSSCSGMDERTFSVWKRWPFLQRFVSCKAMKANIAKTSDLWKWPSFQIIYFLYRKITRA